MEVKSNLAVLMAERLLKITTLSEETGISRTTLTSLYYGKAKGIRFDTLSTLCSYFNCGTGDIIKCREAKEVS